MYFLLICIVSLCSPCLGFAIDYQVVDVIEGDIIKIKYDSKPIQVRLAAIDCPEMDQPWGAQAKQFTAHLVLKKRVAIWPIGVDHYGRILAFVFIDNVDLVKSLLRAGLAWHDRRQSRESLLTALEMEARAAKKGLWSDPERIPPWEWRQVPKNSTTFLKEKLFEDKSILYMADGRYTLRCRRTS